MKRGLFIGGGILLIAVIAAVILLHHNNQQFASGDVKLAQAKAVPADNKPCLTSNDSLKLPSSEVKDIEMATILHIIDVPAGTNVDVRIASANANEVTGSAIYEKDYGTYNFVLAKETNASKVGQPWKVTSFKPCKN